MNPYARSAHLLLLAAALLPACAAPRPRPSLSPAPPPARAWALSGYLPENPGQKVYVTILGNEIRAVGKEKPALPPALLVETSETIFPGFIDLNGPGVDALLPLSPLARSQFRSRAEWRYRAADLDRYARLLPASFSAGSACAAARYGARKALSGGATLLRSGAALPPACRANLGIGQVENPADVAGERYPEATDALPPYLLASVFLRSITPKLAAGASYEAAYRKMLDEEGISAWIETFREEAHTLANAARLLFGNSAGFAPADLSEADFKNHELRLRKYLAGPPHRLSGTELEEELSAARRWIFGGTGGGAGFLKARKDEAAALQFLAAPGVLRFSEALRRYVGAFEPAQRRALAAAIGDPATHAYFLPLAEGAPSDGLAAAELLVAGQLGYLSSGAVLVGGAALPRARLRELNPAEVSLVWSPLPDLLLYGDTLDAGEARRLRIPVSLGTGPSAFGAKTLLDALKIARDALRRAGAPATGRELIEMVTVNPARALRLPERLGAVRPGFLANLTLLHCSITKDPYDCAVEASPREVSLVVSGGEARFGEEELLARAAAAAGSGEAPEAWPPAPVFGRAPCPYRKAFQETGASVAALREELAGAIQRAYGSERALAPAVDALFSCEDETYARRMIELPEELKDNRARRAALRKERGLADGWTPASLPAAEAERAR